jgi:6-pyruvoyltetrahydropterin/6-carboxytetrahydropterin synthase
VANPYQVRVEGLQFDAAHFATFGGACEPLHGHSYAVAAEVEGTLSEDNWVVDFIELKLMLRKLCEEVDHRFLLQSESRLLQIERRPGEWRVQTPAGIAYIFPESDVVSLPIENTTAERLAEWFSDRLWRSLQDCGAKNIAAATVEVWEGPEQRASHRRERLLQE